MFMKNKISVIVKNFNEVVEEIIRRAIFGNNGMTPALAGLDQQQPSPTRPQFDLKEILDKGFVWCPTPKHRTSAEKKLTKRFTHLPNSLMTKWATPKTNIIPCLECGNFHEKGRLCGTCYAKVKSETSAIHDAMFKNDEFKYAYPPQEVRFKYMNDPAPEEADPAKKFVEIPKNRPDWFDSNLVAKVNSQK